MRKILFSIAIIIVLLLVAAGLSTMQQKDDVGEWETYTNEAYGFTVDHPTGWVVFDAGDDQSAPKINIYKPGHREGNLPFDHFANATHVSFFPQGIPTEGLVSITEEGDSLVNFPTDQSIRFVLDDGKTFASYSKPSNPPRSWNQSGFVWARGYMPNISSECRHNGNAVTEGECDVFGGGDTIVFSGSLDTDEWAVIEQILASITFTDVEEVTDESPHSLITVDTPEIGEIVQSPLRVSGEARGQWYFEGSFPVTLTNWDGLIIAEGFATADGEWMTTDFVPFEGTIEFESPATEDDPDFMKNGTLIFQKDNPSGLPEHDDAYEIRVRFVE